VNPNHQIKLLSCSLGPTVKDFERGHTGGWHVEKGGSHSIQIVDDPIDSTNQVVRFEVRAGDQWWWDRKHQKHAERAELSEYSYYYPPYGKDMWYRFRTFISPEWKTGGVRCLIAQWHALPDDGEVWRSPPLGIEYRVAPT